MRGFETGFLQRAATFDGQRVDHGFFKTPSDVSFGGLEVGFSMNRIEYEGLETTEAEVKPRSVRHRRGNR